MRAAIYCRLSEEDRNKLRADDESNSIQNQKTMLLQYAMEQGWEIYRIYSDDDYTGADRRRPEFNRLLQDAEARKFDVVLCKTQSRFTRELELVEKYLHGLFPAWGIRFVSVVDNADTANKGNKKSRQINGLVNEWYLEDMSENIKSVLTSRRMNGLHIGAFALYGYQKDPLQKGRLIIDEEAAAVVREVFRLFDQGYGKTAIARLLNDRGIPNPSEYKRLHGLRYRAPERRNSTLWKYYTISDMLVNEIYIGNMVQGKYGSVSYKTKQNKPRPKSEWYVVEGTHEPIVDRALWDRVQKRIAERARPFAAGAIGLFARKVICAHCGYTMRTQKSNGRRYLCCSSRHVSKDACIGSFLSVDRLERMVLSRLNEFAAESLDQDALERGIACRQDWLEQEARLQRDLSAYQKKIAEYDRGLRDLYLDRARGLLDEQEFAGLSREFAAEKRRLERMAADTEAACRAVRAQRCSGDDRKELARRYAALEHLNRAMVDTLIDRIVVYRKEPGAPDPRVEIYWSF